MPRRNRPPKRKIAPDIKYNSVLVSRFINKLMIDGKKSTSVRIMYGALAAAVITDVGAPLSHAAIVARELGIPAVVGCGSATTCLRTGDRVRVDGGRGIVEISVSSQ